MTDTTPRSGFLANVSTAGETVPLGIGYAAVLDATGDYTPIIYGWKMDGLAQRTVDVGVFKTPTSMLLTPAEDNTNINWSVLGYIATPSSKSGYVPNVSTAGTTVPLGITFSALSDITGDYTPSIFGWKVDGATRRFIDVGVYKTPSSMILTPAENGTNISWSVLGYAIAPPIIPVASTGAFTSQTLIDELAGVQTIGTEKITFTKSQVLFAGTFAQNDILTRLKLVDQAVRLALVAGQESYTFPPQVPTAASTASNGEVILSITGHPFHVGDEVVVFGTTGGGDGRWYLTIPDANSIQLAGSVADSPAVVSTSRVYHGLMACLETSDRAPIRKVSNASGALTGFIKKISHGQYESFRDEFSNSTVDESSVINCMVEDTSPCITLQFQGTPGADLLVEVKIVRKPLPCERLTEAVDPIIPAGYEELFILATRAFMYRYRTEAVFSGYMYGQRFVPGVKDQAWNDYQQRLKEVDEAVTSRRVVFIQSQPGEGWW